MIRCPDRVDEVFAAHRPLKREIHHHHIRLRLSHRGERLVPTRRDSSEPLGSQRIRGHRFDYPAGRHDGHDLAATVAMEVMRRVPLPDRCGTGHEKAAATVRAVNAIQERRSWKRSDYLATQVTPTSSPSASSSSLASRRADSRSA